MIDKSFNEIKQCFFDRTAKSKEMHSQAAYYLPGGDTRAATHFEPYPVYLTRGDGCHVYDCDGNKYIDFLNNFTQQILGHNHPKIKQAVQQQLEQGTIFGAPHDSQTKLAKLLCERIPSVDRIRFCNSGTEATMHAIKAARAFTGKNKIIKVEGIYHGTHDLVETSVFPPLNKVGDSETPNRVPYNSGIPKNIFENIVIVPFNNQTAMEKAIRNNKKDLAAIIMEPIMSAAGVIPATEDYLSFVREISANEKILLIFDEIVTFRLAPGGAQELYGVTPDITTIGKFIGGGFPVGAFGGKKEIMSLFAPSDGIFSGSGTHVKHSGTFNGHPIIMKAGLATMEELTTDVYNRINALGDLLRKKLNEEVFDDLGIKARASGWGSLSYIHYTIGKISNYRDARQAVDQVQNLPVLVHLQLLNEGIWIAERGEIALSTPMTEKDIDEAVDAYKKTFLKLRPSIEHDLPHLIRS